MVLLIAFGVLNVTAMVILASIVLVAKRFTRGGLFAHDWDDGVGLAVAVVRRQGLAAVLIVHEP
jgi:predicted metal-binding membrane protein